MQLNSVVGPHQLVSSHTKITWPIFEVLLIDRWHGRLVAAILVCNWFAFGIVVVSLEYCRYLFLVVEVAAMAKHIYWYRKRNVYQFDCITQIGQITIAYRLGRTGDWFTWPPYSSRFRLSTSGDWPRLYLCMMKIRIHSFFLIQIRRHGDTVRWQCIWNYLGGGSGLRCLRSMVFSTRGLSDCNRSVPFWGVLSMVARVQYGDDGIDDEDGATVWPVLNLSKRYGDDALCWCCWWFWCR